MATTLRVNDRVFSAQTRKLGYSATLILIIFVLLKSKPKESQRIVVGAENRFYGAEMHEDSKYDNGDETKGEEATASDAEGTAQATSKGVADDSSGLPSDQVKGQVKADDSEPFDAPVRGEPVDDPDIDGLVVNLDGYEGPLDVLLELARSQKVDIRTISMVLLVDQYLEFVEEARSRDLELAADYLVMASWLTFMKSRLLIPQSECPEDEPTADEMANILAFQLQRLEAMRSAAEALYSMPRLGINVFSRGDPEGVRVIKTPDWQADMFDLLKAYTTQRIQTVDRHYTIVRPKVFSLEEARTRLARILGTIPEWSDLQILAPHNEVDAPASSVMASAFHAALELAKAGKIDLRQVTHFDPIYVRTKNDQSNHGSDDDQGGGQESDIDNAPVSISVKSDDDNMSKSALNNAAVTPADPVVGSVQNITQERSVS